MTAATDAPAATIHPFLADLPIFETEVEALTESIREVGLLHPVVLDAEGQVIGGRHRLVACGRLGIEAEFETYEGDPLAFILHDNATRKHQTTAQRAAENALSLDAAKRRRNGRWERGTAAIYESVNSEGAWSVRMAECGLILDHLGREALITVALGDRALHEVHGEAVNARDAERDRQEREAREAQEESDAEEFVRKNAPDLAEQAEQAGWSWTAARTEWERRNREEAERLRAEKAERERKESERVAGIKRIADYLQSWAASHPTAVGLRTHPDRAEILAAMHPANRAKFLELEKTL